jgi:hypothetical protein
LPLAPPLAEFEAGEDKVGNDDVWVGNGDDKVGRAAFAKTEKKIYRVKEESE